MRYVIYGAGAIGGVIGAKLFESEQRVVLIARGEHLDHIASDGLRLESPTGAVTLPIPVVAGPSEVGFEEDDIVILAMKSQDTVAAVAALAESASTVTPVVCAQNGVENERVAKRCFANVYGMCVMCPATHLAPGVVQVNSTPVPGLLDLGCWPSGIDATAETIAADLVAAGFDSIPRADITRWKWGKLMLNIGNAVEALCGRGRGSEVVELGRAEAVACLAAAGIDYVGPAEDEERRADLLRIEPIGGVARGGGSSWQSLRRSTGAIESDYLNGEIVLLGRIHGVPTPVNVILQVMARRAAVEGVAPGSVPPERLLEAIG